ncbi:DNA fragmentation factor subunit beta isoform X4 [Strigops habroptila]|uniref:DNA fragmentation factor subunit beta isoform X4 n=1 Tax=Strigops habroptila TaxID=2489341 RepID=UPI0011CFEEB7|nr:DNA fragmentation factor subunit beta isoform X4 [Strigops habroptila]
MAEPLRAFRVRGRGNPQKFGVAAGSLRGLLRKGCRLLQLPLPGSRLCLYEDGTELTESYFRALPPQTELVLLGPGESWQGCECAGAGRRCRFALAAGASDIERLLAAFYTQREAVVEAARKLLTDERAPRRQRLLADLIHNLSENILAEDKEEDEKWFEGLESRFKNKSSYMRYSCESRIRSYMKEVSSFISNVHPTARDAYKRITDLMADKLKSVKYNGCYFDRREEEEGARLCTTEGWFSCQGPFDRDDCPCKHSINPYSNRESRILFSTWNLDHIIEKKRAVVPELAEAVKTQDGREVNWEYFYQLLFTVDNLKLVHIACHKKTNHNLSCDKTKIYKRRKHNHRIS